MATKSASKKKQGKSSANPSNYSEIYKSSAATAAQQVPAPAPANGSNGKSASATRKPEAPQAALAGSDTVDWKGEYGYVLDDLRYLGIVTGSILIAIIVVGLIL